MTADLRQRYYPFHSASAAIVAVKELKTHWDFYRLSGVKRDDGTTPTRVFPQPQSLVVVRVSLAPLSSSPTCFSASLISSPPLCFSYTPSQSNKGMRGRKANKPVVVQRGRSVAGQRHEDRGRRGNEVESEPAVPLGPNQDSPVCVCLPTWMNMYLCDCAPMYLWLNVCMCVQSCIQCMCADSALAGSAAHHTANCWLHSTCFVLALLCSAPIISLGACTELDRELCLTHCYSSLSLQLFSPWFIIAEDTSVRVRSKLSTKLLTFESNSPCSFP